MLSLSATTIGVALNPVQASRPQVAWPQVLPVQSSSTPQPLFNQTPRLHSCFTTPRPQIWAPSPTQPSPTNTPQPSCTANLLQLCPPLVRSCYGCSQTLKPGGTIGNPPHDLVIISRMKRSYRDPSTLEMRSREGNVYFHVHESCIRKLATLFRSTNGIDTTRSFNAFENRTFALFTTIWFARLNIIITKEVISIIRHHVISIIRHVDVISIIIPYFR